MPFGAVTGVLHTVLEMIERGATHLGVATDHVIESFRNRLWPGYKTGQGVERALLAQFHPLEEALAAMGVAVWLIGRGSRRHESHQFVILSGLPASGKTTLARALSLELDLPLLDKDSFLEALFAAEGTGDSEWRRSLSERADMSFRQAALAKRRAVLASWWRHPQSTADSGTPTDWLAPASSLVEVHCACSASVAAARFLARTRHPGHLDHQRSAEGLLSMLEEQQDFGPLFPSRAIVVNTEREVTLTNLVSQVRRMLREDRGA